MYHQQQLVRLHMDAVTADLQNTRGLRNTTRSSPRGPGLIRSLVAKALVLSGARIHGSTPAVFGDRVVLLDPCRDDDLRLAA